MPKTRQEKEQVVDTLVEKINSAKSVIFANFQGLKVSESEELRQKCRESGIEYFATKKTLLKKALQKVGVEVETGEFEGGVSVAFGVEDEVLPAQTLDKFAKDHKDVKFFGGMLEGKYIDMQTVDNLAKLPGKQELLARMVGSMNAPISGFVNVLSGNMRGLLNVLNAIKENKA